MKHKSIIVLLLIILTFNIYASETVDLNEITRRMATLRECIAILVIQLMEVLVLIEWEDLRPETRSQISATIETCKQILRLLAYE